MDKKREALEKNLRAERESKLELEKVIENLKKELEECKAAEKEASAGRESLQTVNFKKNN